MTALVSAVLLIPSYTCAATYQWDDARSPFQEPITEIKKMHPATVKVFLPDHINAHDNIPLTIDTVLTHGNYFEGKIYLNTESEWGVYRFRSPSW